MAHSISTVSLHSSTVSIKPLKYPLLCTIFTQVKHDFRVKLITLFQTFLELCNRSDAMLVTSNAVEIFASLHLPVSNCNKRNSFQSPQTCCVLVHLITQHIKQHKTNVYKLEHTLNKWKTCRTAFQCIFAKLRSP